MVERLAREGEVTAAFKLAKVALDVTAKHDAFWYRDLFQRHLPALVKADGVQAFKLLCRTLKRALARDNGGDGAFIWRAAIEEHEQNSDRPDKKDALVSAVRDAGEQILRGDPSVGEQVFDFLDSLDLPIFRRIELHMLRVAPESAGDRIERRLADRALLEAAQLHHEYALLLKERFPTLSPDAQNRILDWIDQGPEYARESGEAEGERHKLAWQLQWLHIIRDSLSGEWLERYQVLSKEHGEPEHPEFLIWHTSWWGETSPLTQEQMTQMGPKRMLSYLRDWQPPRERFGPSPSVRGLGRALASVVAQDAGSYARVAREFETGIRSTYVRSLFDGLQEAVKKGQSLSWAPVLDLCTWVMAQPRDPADPQVGQTEEDEDDGWGATRAAIADLLLVGLERQPLAAIPRRFRWKIWRILEQLATDPDPTPEYEARYGGENMDPGTLSLNTVRGKAMHAVVAYASWCVQHVKTEQSDRGRNRPPLAIVPEVRRLLEWKLDPAVEPSCTVRAVFGWQLPFLVYLDSKWLQAQLPHIFPQEPSLGHLRDAAWEAYLQYAKFYNQVFQLLELEYRAAVERLTSAPSQRQGSHTPTDRLGVHLMVAYWRGMVPLEGGDSLLASFFEGAPEATRAQAIAFVGRQLSGLEKDQLDQEVVERLKRLWVARIAAARASALTTGFAEELAAFGHWFSCEYFDPGWALVRLSESLELTSGRVQLDFRVVERLAALAADLPLQAIGCLDQMVKGDKEGWHIDSWREAARQIIAAVLSCNDGEASAKARELVNYIGARGFHYFRDLLGEPDTS
ncbi:MAG: hypothetical protein HYX89_06475 [Chloroflexi bacterium]|nr:hypothetical protein [Chloroflexota bacterium]